MKINTQFKLRQIAGETIIVQQGQTEANLTQVISLNKTACLLYEQLKDKEFTVEDAAKILIDTYEIDTERAAKDAQTWADSLKDCGVISE